MVSRGEAENVGNRLYRLTEAVSNELETIAMVAAAVPNAVICLVTALQVHEIGTQSPHSTWIALDRRALMPTHPPTRLRIVRSSGPMVTYGVVHRSARGVPFRITSPARTVLDCFRYRNKLGLDVAIEALHDELRSRVATVFEIMRAAEECRARTIMRAYLEALPPWRSGALRNVGASVRARLLERSRGTGEVSNSCCSGTQRSGSSIASASRPIVSDLSYKGAMLLGVWSEAIYRPTRDLDFAGYGSALPDDIRSVIHDICAVQVADDEVVISCEVLTLQSIRGQDDYDGNRTRFDAMLDGARLPMRIDIGFGNAIQPPPIDAHYPALLDAPRPRIRAYPREAVVAEKNHCNGRGRRDEPALQGFLRRSHTCPARSPSRVSF